MVMEPWRGGAGGGWSCRFCPTLSLSFPVPLWILVNKLVARESDLAAGLPLQRNKDVIDGYAVNVIHRAVLAYRKCLSSDDPFDQNSAECVYLVPILKCR
ncbi:hypothetical protein R1flu_004911 [Riccia fluitans]|uniref:Uncharacterized protein n=1 Tax=Riccia fluitans TaxID=41844 RepID=A0ABD1YUN9_9MARC